MTKELLIEQDEGYITQEGAGAGIKLGRVQPSLGPHVAIGEGAGEGIEQDHGTIKELVLAGPIVNPDTFIGGGSSNIRDVNPGL